MRSVYLVLDPPFLMLSRGVSVAAEEPLIEAFIAQSDDGSFFMKPFCIGFRGTM
jgi:hypothetical protein